MELEAVALKKALECELALDSRDLRSHAWYHGPIPRQRAEEILKNDGDFLVRDCISQPGNFVLSCKNARQPLHFVLNKLIVQPDTVYERVQYQFEDEPFDTVPDLITFYVGSERPISAASGARIHSPCNRLCPLSYYATKYGALSSKTTSPLTVTSGATKFNQSNAYRSPTSSPTFIKRDLPPRLPTKKHRSQSLTVAQAQAQNLILKQGEHIFHSEEEISNVQMSDPNYTNTNEQKGEFIPAKPIKDRGKDENAYRVVSYHTSGSDSGNGSGDSAQSFIVTEESLNSRCGVIIKNPYYISNSASSMTLKNYAEIDPVVAEAMLRSMEIPQISYPSMFDLENFHTALLPCSEFRPLDTETLATFRMMICETSPRIIANHITRIDIKLILGSSDENSQNVLDRRGLELIMLEQGRQFRLDLIERTQCLKLLVAATILTCPTNDERAEILNKWIQIAVDAKTAIGNLFAFGAIMLGICMPQILKLEATWHHLRQKHTNSAFNFEAKLRPTLKSMNECTNPQAPNTTIPHILPYILLRDSSIDQIFDPSYVPSTLVKACITPCESMSQDFGFSIFFAHLDSTRTMCNNLSIYRNNAKIVLNDQSRLDPLLEEAFRTEFHIKFLWGSRGAFSTAIERHTKFEQVLEIMANKLADCSDTE